MLSLRKAFLRWRDAPPNSGNSRNKKANGWDWRTTNKPQWVLLGLLRQGLGWIRTATVKSPRKARKGLECRRRGTMMAQNNDRTIRVTIQIQKGDRLGHISWAHCTEEEMKNLSLNDFVERIITPVIAHLLSKMPAWKNARNPNPPNWKAAIYGAVGVGS